MSIYIGIISYLPDDLAKRDKRREFIRKEVDFVRIVFPHKPINIVCQNWKGEKLDANNINYIESAPVGPAGARNIHLRIFYKSDYDHILLLDDDMTVYDYYGVYELFREIDRNPRKFAPIDMVVANNPLYLPFKKQNYADKLIKTHWKFQKRPFNTGQQVAVIKNISKYYGKALFYTETNVQPFHEDTDWQIRWALAGYTSYYCPQMQERDMGNQFSTLYSRERRVEEEKACALAVVSRFPFAYKMIKPGNPPKVDYSYLKPFNVSKVVGYISRETAWDYTEKEIPKMR